MAAICRHILGMQNEVSRQECIPSQQPIEFEQLAGTCSNSLAAHLDFVQHPSRPAILVRYINLHDVCNGWRDIRLVSPFKHVPMCDAWTMEHHRRKPSCFI